MKKNFKLYTVAWVVALLLFNVVSFVAPLERTASFWIGYALISAAFVGQIACAFVAFKDDNATKVFYRLSLIKINIGGLVVSLVVGALCMIIAPLPYWVGIIASAVVLALNIIALLKGAAVIGEVERIDTKIKEKTAFINLLTADADTLVAAAKSDEVKAECVKVYEAVRYSDPMSSDALTPVEEKISASFSALYDAVKVNDAVAVTSFASEVLLLIKERNNKCKALK